MSNNPVRRLGRRAVAIVVGTTATIVLVPSAAQAYAEESMCGQGGSDHKIAYAHNGHYDALEFLYHGGATLNHVHYWWNKTHGYKMKASCPSAPN